MHDVELRSMLWAGILRRMSSMLPMTDKYDISDHGDWVYFPRAEHLIRELRAVFQAKRISPAKGI
jgi:hypothetical protein